MFAINIPTVAIQRAAVTFFLFANFVYEKFCGFIHNDGNIVVQTNSLFDFECLYVVGCDIY